MTENKNSLIKIIQSPSDENPFIVLYKPQGIPSAPLKEGESGNAFSEACNLYPEILQVNGLKKCEHGLLHRIDAVTKGLLVIATTQSAYDFLQQEQKQQHFIKYYRAKCRNNSKAPLILGNFPSSQNYHQELLKNKIVYISSCFRPFGLKHSQVRPVNEFSGKAAQKKSGSKNYFTQIKIIQELPLENKISVECRITEGFRHQIRCHLSWIGFPIAGDNLYDPEPAEDLIDFEAYKISFPHPITKKIITFEV